MTSPKTSSQKNAYDLILRGGRVVDPAQRIDKVMDLAIRNGEIAALKPRIPATGAQAGAKSIDVSGKLVLPGLIDAHAHVYEHGTTPFGVNPDIPGVRSGVAVLIDQGSSTPFTFPGFKKFIIEPSANEIYAFMSIYLGGGLFANMHSDWLAPHNIDVGVAVDMIKANRDLIRGVKVQTEVGTYSRWKLKTLELAIEAAREAGVPVYMHLGHLFPIARGKKVDPIKLVREATAMLDAGDIMAHPFSRDPGAFVMNNGKVNPAIRKAIDRGVKVDVGRGSHFSFDTARAALDGGLVPDTCGLDMHGINIRPNGMLTNRDKMIAAGTGRVDAVDLKRPVVSISLPHAMTELLALGLPLTDVVRMVTVNAARMIGRQRAHGSLRVGRTADVTVMNVREGEWTLHDFHGGSAPATQRLEPAFVIRRGKKYKADVRVAESVASEATTPLYKAFAA